MTDNYFPDETRVAKNTPHSLKHLPVIAIEGPQSAPVQDQLAQFI